MKQNQTNIEICFCSVRLIHKRQVLSPVVLEKYCLNAFADNRTVHSLYQRGSAPNSGLGCSRIFLWIETAGFYVQWQNLTTVSLAHSLLSQLVINWLPLSPTTGCLSWLIQALFFSLDWAQSMLCRHLYFFSGLSWKHSLYLCLLISPSAIIYNISATLGYKSVQHFSLFERGYTK